MKKKKKKLLVVGTIISMTMIGIIFLVIRIQQPKIVDTGSLVVQPSPEMIAYYEKTYGPGLVSNKTTFFPYYKDQTENLKWIAYFEGYSDYAVYGKKAGPTYSSDAFKGLDKEDLNKNKKLYKKMYKIGYKEARY